MKIDALFILQLYPEFVKSVHLGGLYTRCPNRHNKPLSFLEKKQIKMLLLKFASEFVGGTFW